MVTVDTPIEVNGHAIDPEVAALEKEEEEDVKAEEEEEDLLA